MISNEKKLLVILGLTMSAAWISQSLMDLCILILLGVLNLNMKQFLGLRLFESRQSKLIFSSFIGYFIVSVLTAIFNAHAGYDSLGNLSKFVWVFQFLLFYWAAMQID